LAALKKLMTIPCLQDRILVGGTGLALYLGHRLSIDIDLFSPQPFDTPTFVYEMSEFGKIELIATSPISLHLNFDNVKTDIVKYPYGWIRPVIFEESMRVAAIEDIAAMKLAAITNRGSKKDFYDIFFLLQRYTLNELLSFFKTKFPNWNEFMVLQSLGYFEDAESTETPKVLLGKITWNQVKKTVGQAVKNYS